MRKPSGGGLVALVLLGATLALGPVLALIAVSTQGAPDAPNQTTTVPVATRSADDGLVIEDLSIGDGAEISEGSWVVLHYTGTLLDGTQFESSRDPGSRPLETFVPGNVLEGWNRGLIGMRAGGVRKLTIPPHLAFGDRPPRGSLIKPGDTLVFVLECLDVQRAPNVQLPRGISISATRAGAGEPARFGTWLTVHIMIMAGNDLRVVYNSRDRGLDPLDVALPGPPGILKRFSPNPRIPGFGEILYGIRAGEFRTATVPAQYAFGSRGDPILGIGPNEELTYEIECLKHYEGPVIELANGLRIEDLKVGEGDAAGLLHYVTLRYERRQADGTVVESNTGPDDEPLTVRLPTRRVLAGWNIGLQGMRVGGVRRLTIPSSLAYGVNPPPETNVKPGETLIYDITLIDTKRRRR